MIVITFETLMLFFLFQILELERLKFGVILIIMFLSLLITNLIFSTQVELFEEVLIYFSALGLGFTASRIRLNYLKVKNK